MVPRFTPFALALAGLSATYAYADNTTPASWIQ